MVNGGHIKKNVWEIMRCPEYALKCNKSVHLPARVSFLCLLGDLSAICAASALGDFPLIEEGRLETTSALLPISAAENLDQFEPRRFLHQIPVL